MRKNVFSIHGKHIVDLIKENQREPAPQPAVPTPGAWVQGNHNIVISGGRVSIHLPAGARLTTEPSAE